MNLGKYYILKGNLNQGDKGDFTAAQGHCRGGRVAETVRGGPEAAEERREPRGRQEAPALSGEEGAFGRQEDTRAQPEGIKIL